MFLLVFLCCVVLQVERPLRRVQRSPTDCAYLNKIKKRSVFRVREGGCFQEL
jgi:hypothetical protein